MIDDAILLDCPPDLMKRLKAQRFHIQKNLRAIVISHFHADHDFDIPFILYFARPLTIIAPAGARERYKTLCEFSNFTQPSKTLNECTIIEIGETEIANGIELDGYHIKPYRVEHAGMDNTFAFTVTKDDKTAAFNGDSVLCDGVHSILENADIAFLDIAGTTPAHLPRIYHMDIPEFEKLISQYPNCKIIPTHMNDDTKLKLTELDYNPPSDNEEYII